MATARQTTDLLGQLRELMKNKKYVGKPIDAYIVPSNDAHNSEYIAECDTRRAYISGFNGSAGTAVITQQHALLWTDGRYYIQAAQELDSNWILMKETIPSTPTQGRWLSKNLQASSRIGFDPKLMAHDKFISLKSEVELSGNELVPIETNLIDLIWPNKPNIPCNPVIPLEYEYTGSTIYKKWQMVVEQMKDQEAKYLVLTALDAIAYFLNLRGSDIEYNPLFFSYVVINLNGYTVFMNSKQYSKEVEKHLEKETTDKITFKIMNYEDIFGYLKNITKGIDGKIWFSETASYALTNLVPPKSILPKTTPIDHMKSIKTETELSGMKKAHLKDAVALCSYFSWIENNLNKEVITEMSAAKKLIEFRKLQNDFVGPSFATINAVGANAALAHYSVKDSTNARITTNEIFLCDSGGQYKDGTTDITRTFHFGTPTEFEKECYTRVLKGQIQLGTTIFPTKIRGNVIDSFARQYLWDIGLDYGHGTGHGIGSYLNVHEGPSGIHWRHMPSDEGLLEGMILSNEPGYYEEGKFGMRIEDDIAIVKAKTPYNSQNRGFLTFETISLVPIQTKMIKTDLLTEKELNHLNNYHQKCRDVIGPVLDKEGLVEVKKWLWKETEPISFKK